MSVIPAFLGLMLLARPAAAVELRLAYTDQDVRPYLMGKGNSIPARPGMAVELAQRSAERVGGLLTLSRLPGRRLIEEVRAGRVDGVLGLRHTDSRADDLMFPMRDGVPDSSRRAVQLAHSLYRRAGEPVQWDGQRISGLNGPVAVSSTMLIADTLRALGVAITDVESSGQMFGMLALHRVDAVAILDVLGDRQMKQQSRDMRVEKLSPPLLVVDFYLPVSQQFYAAHRDFTERLWQAMGELRDATYAELTPDYLF